MTISQWLDENLGALVVAVIASVFASLGAVLTVIVFSAEFVRGEWSYGIPLAFGLPVAVVAGIVVFLVVFGKLR